jgi:DNA replication protein DnaC
MNGMKDVLPQESMKTSSNDDTQENETCSLCGRQSICGGLGYVRYDLPIDHPNFGQLFRCPNEPSDPARVKQLRKIGNLEVFIDKTFANFYVNSPSLTSREAQSLQAALTIAINYAKQPQGWLLIEGAYGCGKTHLAAAIGNERLQYGDAPLLVTTPDLLDYLRNTYGPSSEVGYDETFDRLRNSPLLILDDLGVENPSAWAQEKLFQLLNHRYTHNLSTVITTNTDIESLDPRIRSRLLDRNIIQRIRIIAPDHRRQLEDENNILLQTSQYNNMRFDNFDISTNTTSSEHTNLEKALKAARNYAEDQQGWFLMRGDYGTGKTHLAAAIANYWEELGLDVLFITVPDLLDYLRQSFSPSSTTTFDRRFNEIRNAHNLILDDLGTESATGWAKEKLFQILNHRYTTPLSTVITTSLPFNKIEPRILSRLLDQRRCKAFEITVRSYAERNYYRK